MFILTRYQVGIAGKKHSNSLDCRLVSISLIMKINPKIHELLRTSSVVLPSHNYAHYFWNKDLIINVRGCKLAVIHFIVLRVCWYCRLHQLDITANSSWHFPNGVHLDLIGFNCCACSGSVRQRHNFPKCILKGVTQVRDTKRAKLIIVSKNHASLFPCRRTLGMLL